MFRGYCGTHFRNASPHIPADRNVLPVSAVHLLLLKSELLRKFHKESWKILFVSLFQSVCPRGKNSHYFVRIVMKSCLRSF